MFDQFKFQAFIIALLGSLSFSSCLLGLDDDDIKVGRTPEGGFCVYGEFELPNTNTYERDTDTHSRHDSRNEHNERWWDDREPSYNNYERDDRSQNRAQVEHKQHLANKAPCGKGLCKLDFDDLKQITASHRHVSRQVDRYSPTTQLHKGSYFLQLSRKYEGEAGVHATELEIIRDFRQGYDQVAKGYDEDDKLVDLGRQMLYEAEELLLLGKPLIEYATFLRRARDILVYLDQPKAKTSDLPELSNRAHGLIWELGNSPKHYLSDPQNIVNGGLRLEIIDCANKVAEADFYATSYLDGDLLGTFALVTGQEAYELGEEENFGEAFAVQDEANCYARFLHFLGDLERSDTAALAGAGEIIGSAVTTGSKVLAKGIAKGAMNAGTSLSNMAATAVTNPMQAAGDFAYYRFALPLLLGNVILRACTDREKLWEDGRQFADVVRDYLTNSSGEQMAEDSIAFMVEALIFAKIRGVGGKAAKAVGNKIKDIAAFTQLQKGLKNTAAKGKECVKRVFSKQTKAVLNDTEKIVQKGVPKESGNSTRKKISLTGKISGKVARTDEVLNHHRTAAPRINAKHIFTVGKNKRGRLVGKHHTGGLEKISIVEIVIPPTKHGTFGAYFEIDGIRKYSDFFPLAWNRAKVLQKIKEAFLSPVEINDHGLVGVTSEGIKIEMFFMKLNETGEYIINSAYPKLG